MTSRASRSRTGSRRSNRSSTSSNMQQQLSLAPDTDSQNRKSSLSSVTSVGSAVTPLSTICLPRSGMCATRGLPEMEYEGARHLQPERLPSARTDRAVTLKLVEITEENLDHMFNIAKSLKRLDLTSTRLISIPKDLIDQLTVIERIILDHNDIKSSSFPDSFGDLSTLKELSLAQNKMSEVPDCWTKLRHLTRLNLEDNHFPNVKQFDKLKRLKCLVLDGNNISILSRDFYMSKRLELLYLARNKLSNITTSVKMLTNLRVVDLSENNLQSLPTDIFMLPKLECLNASKNRINRIPALNIKGRTKRRIFSVNLSENALTRFPEYLMRITENLDLSCNRIKTIPGSLLKRIDYHSTQNLDISSNIMIFPPADVCEGGLKAMVQFYHETKIESKNYQGLKVLMLGCTGGGKTSFLQTIIDQQKRLTEPDEDTKGMEVYEMLFETDASQPGAKTLSVSCFDFSGDSYYTYFNHNFLQYPTLTIIAVPLPNYTTKSFQEKVGQWLDLLIVASSNLIILLIGTKSDLMESSDAASQKMKLIKRDCERYIQKYMAKIDEEIGKIESLSQISAALTDRYKHFQQLKETRILLLPETLITSSKKMIGVEKFEEMMIHIASETDTFPLVMRVVPSLWVDVENHFEDRASDDPVTTFSFYSELIQNKFGLRPVAKTIAQYLHESGKAFWTEENPYTKDNIVFSIPILIECLTSLFRPNISDFLTNPNDPQEIRRRFNKEFLPSRYNHLVEEFINEGVLDPDIVHALWGNCLTGSCINRMLEYVCVSLKLGYPIGKKSKEGSYTLSPLALYSSLEKQKPEILSNENELGKQDQDLEEEVQAAKPTKSSGGAKAPRVEMRDVSLFTDNKELPRVIIPMHRQTADPSSSCVKDWNRLKLLGWGVSVIVKFNYVPPSAIFDRSVVHFHDFEKFKCRYLCHWKDGVQMRSLTQPCVLQVLRNSDEEGSSEVQFSVHFDPELARLMKLEFSDNPESRSEFLWKTLLPLLREFEEILTHYPGVWFERLLRCPSCNEPTFMGEWLTPKETQTLPHRKCELCQAEISTAYLVQPKEKLKAEEIIKMKQKILEKKRKQETRKHASSSEPSINPAVSSVLG